MLASHGVEHSVVAIPTAAKDIVIRHGERTVFSAPRAQLQRTWSELSYSPVDWFRAGVVVQRTKAYQTPLDTQRGVLAGVSFKSADLSCYVFNFGWTDPTVVLSVGIRI